MLFLNTHSRVKLWFLIKWQLNARVLKKWRFAFGQIECEKEV